MATPLSAFFALLQQPSKDGMSLCCITVSECKVHGFVVITLDPGPHFRVYPGSILGLSGVYPGSIRGLLSIDIKLVFLRHFKSLSVFSLMFSNHFVTVPQITLGRLQTKDKPKKIKQNEIKGNVKKVFIYSLYRVLF